MLIVKCVYHNMSLLCRLAGTSSAALLMLLCPWLFPSSDLLNEQMLRKQAELESAQCRLQLQVLIDKCTKLNSRVQVSLSFLIQKTSGIRIQKKGSLRRT
jgi:hypothetical protein